MSYTENDRKSLEFKLEKNKFLLSMAKNKKSEEGIKEVIKEVEDNLKSIT